MPRNLTYRREDVVCRINRSELIANAGIFKPFAYSKSNGRGYKSIIVCGESETVKGAFKKSYDGKTLTITLDWDKVKMNRARESVRILIYGDYGFHKRYDFNLVFPTKMTPYVYEFNGNGSPLLWGGEQSLGTVVISSNVIDSERWKYHNADFIIQSTDNFSFTIGGESICVKASKPIRLSLVPGGVVSIPVRYNYGSEHIDAIVSKSFEFVDSMGKHNSTSLSFEPIAPEFDVTLNREFGFCFDLISHNGPVARLAVNKTNLNAADLKQIICKPSIKAISIQHVSNSNNLFDVFLVKEYFKGGLSDDLDVEIFISASNAPTRQSVHLFFTKKSNTSKNTIQLISPKFEITGLDSDISVYSGVKKQCANSFSIFNPGRYPLSNVKVEIYSPDSRCVFENEKRVFLVSTLQPNEKADISFKLEDEGQNVSHINVKASALYSEQIEKELLIRFITRKESDSFIQVSPIPESEHFFFLGESYNEACGVFQIQYTIPANQDPLGYKPLNLDKVVLDDTFGVFSISKEDSKERLYPGDSCCFSLRVEGMIPIETKHITIFGTPVFSSFKKKEYYVKRVANDLWQVQYPVTGDGVVQVGSFTFDNETRTDCFFDEGEQIILLSDDCFFEEGERIANIDSGDPVPVYMNVKKRFNNANNIDTEQEISFEYSVRYPHFPENENRILKKAIKVKPFVAKAEPTLFFICQDGSEYPLPIKNENGIYPSVEEFPIVVHYTSEMRREDRSIKLGSLCFANKTSIPYARESACFKDVRFYFSLGTERQQEASFIQASFPEEIKVDNGECPVSVELRLLWKDCPSPDAVFVFPVTFICNNDKCSTCLYISLVEDIVDNIFSLDLGTSGIVVAKQEDYSEQPVVLSDFELSDFRIEKDDELISSLCSIEAKLNSDYDADIDLSPSIRALKAGNENTTWILPPAKFIVGQKHIPFLNKLSQDFGEGRVRVFNTGSVFSLKENCEQKYLSPDKFLIELYAEVFRRMGEESYKMKKLLITYPNTYTYDKLGIIRNLIVEKFPSLKGQVVFIPESDAVVAYYVYRRLNDGVLPPFTNETEKILIYDMGAGTLDMSLVYVINSGGSIDVSINDKIGIPIAGNNLDYELFNGLVSCGLFNETIIDFYKSDDNTANTTKMKEIALNAKDFIKSMKQAFPDDIKSGDKIDISDLAGLSISERQKEIKYSDLSPSIKEYLDICGDKAVRMIAGNKGIDTIVFSGRASQFKPLRKRVLETIKELSGKEPEVHSLTERSNESISLKTAVALGALRYNDTFREQAKYTIRNRNLYSKFGVVFFAPSEDNSHNEPKYVELINTNLEEHRFNESIEDGLYCYDYKGDGIIDLSIRNQFMYFIQSSLPPEEIIDLYRGQYKTQPKKRTDGRWCFVNELFKRNSNDIPHNSEASAVHISLEIRKDYSLIRFLGDSELHDTRLVDNIEDNVFYLQGMWPYIQESLSFNPRSLLFAGMAILLEKKMVSSLLAALNKAP